MKSITLKDLLRTTLTEVEWSTEPDFDDQALAKLKRSLVRSVAELDVQREYEPTLEAAHAVASTHNGR